MTEPGDQQRRIETPRVDVPPPPRQSSSTRRWVIIGLVGCGGLILLLLLLLGGCAAIFAIGSNSDSKSGANKEAEQTVAIGEPVTVGDATWQVTEARQANQLTAQFAEQVQGDFVIVNFDFTNNGSQPLTLSSQSMTLIDSTGRESNADPDKFQYIPRDRNIFLENVNPGVTDQGQAIFTVASGASGFNLQVGDTTAFSYENGYVDLGF